LSVGVGAEGSHWSVTRMTAWPSGRDGALLEQMLFFTSATRGTSFEVRFN
jgi:hypothetical protein